MSITDLHHKYKDEKITYSEAEQLLYNFDRNSRFVVFIALYEATLKNNQILAYKVFREAYCSSDNIYQQIRNSKITFDLKAYLKTFDTNSFDFYNLMRKSEKDIYDKLPNHFLIYRGMNNLEKLSNDFGISWSLSKEEAENYIYFDKNNVKQGGLASKTISKNEVLTVFTVHENTEIIYLA